MLDEEVKENQPIAAIDAKKARRRAAYNSVILMAVLVGISMPIMYSGSSEFTWFARNIYDLAKFYAVLCLHDHFKLKTSIPRAPQPFPQQAEVPSHVIEVEGEVEKAPTGPSICLSPVLSSRKSPRL